MCEIDSNQVLPDASDAKQLPYIGLEHVESGTERIISTISNMDDKRIQSITFRFDTRHVLYGKLRPYLNKVVIPNFKGRCTTELLPLLPKDECNRNYLAWLLRRPETIEEAMRHKTGTRMPRANMDELFKMLVPLPSLSEQKYIASKIQEFMQEVERARSACERQLEAAKTLPAAYIREVFESEEAKKWERKRLKEVLEIIESGSRPKGGVYEIKEGIPSIGAEHLNSFGGFNFDNVRFIPKEFYQGMTKGKIQKGDVLIVKDGATTGKVSFVGDDFPYAYAAVNEHVFKLRAKGVLEQEFLFWFLYSPTGQIQIQQEFHGAAQGGINQQFVNGVYIYIPPLTEQRRIVSELKKRMTQVENLQSAIRNQQSALKILPQAILRKAFRGEL